MSMTFVRKNSKVRYFVASILASAGALLWLLSDPSPPPMKEPEDEEFLRKYRPPIQAGVEKIGRGMEMDAYYWKQLFQDYLKLNRDHTIIESLTLTLAKRFVIVTAASSSFYAKSITTIASIQEFLPQRPIFFYDLTEPESGNAYIRSKIGSLCGVTHRFFNFSLYPLHVRHLINYSWKPLIIKEVLKEHPGVLWLDSSVRLTSNNFTSLFLRVILNDGMMTFISTGHSNFAATHPQMYAFLPTFMDDMTRTDQYASSAILIYRTREAFKNILWWWVLCALDPLCIAPIDRSDCSDPYSSRHTYSDCHRFDQSALNILLANYFGYDYTRYFWSQRVVELRRPEGFDERVHMCEAGKVAEYVTFRSFLSGSTPRNETSGIQKVKSLRKVTTRNSFTAKTIMNITR